MRQQFGGCRETCQGMLEHWQVPVPGGPDMGRWRQRRQEGGRHMPGGTVHGREPEPFDDILDCLAYVRAVQAGDDESAQAVLDVLHLRMAGRADAMVAPLRLACLIVDEAGRLGCDVSAVLASVRDRAGAGRDYRSA